jgi:hypothetical protein
MSTFWFMTRSEYQCVTGVEHIEFDGAVCMRLTDDQIKGLLPTIARTVGGLKMSAIGP